MHRIRYTAVVVVLSAAACSRDMPTGPTAPRVDASVSAVQGPDLPSAADMADRIPGFGGFFLDQDGIPTIYLTRGSSRVPAERLLERYLAARGLSIAALRVREGRHPWTQLERWQEVATVEALAIPGTVFVDNDETRNQVLIGVAEMGAMGLVRAAVARLGIPAEAVILDRADPIFQVATLQNVIDRPVRAGVQINFPGYICSVGFNATTAAGQKSFVTASHCTNTQGGVENTPYWQPLQSVSETQIATEVDDPAYARKGSGCPKGRRCRVSDAARAAYDDGTNQALGLIARTSAPNNRSLEIVGSFSIDSDDCKTLGGCLVVGTIVNKVGRTTGWTAGAITNTCVHTGVSGSNIVQLCQTFVSAGVGGGDSGSDVFEVTGGGDNKVKLAGVLWGGNGAGTQFVFSPLANVFRDLGDLKTH